jgi:DNA-binding response OmpR family regulator
MPTPLGTRVLIADGDQTLRQTLFGRLLDLNVFSDSVANVDEAHTKLAENEYAIVILDVALPGGEVSRLIARIAELPKARRPIVLILAANPEAARSLDVEIVQIVLRKPLRLTHLLDLVRNCLRGTTGRLPIRTESENDEKADGTQKTS